ncbi:tetratricopeptide repeat protein [Candidatus Pantoea floridensis]|uniref:Uncharacterized protein n=1 Tax=Candidatus Pantoea floridensis TaxID=1938870 RepID=A0A286BZF3_9GAMM|nr:tetratricopeptide repeat protein [Pantoea floridensis]PIF22022.1 hypothetical protein BX596_1429 [Enterobacteriaceae bacterium JKS000233]SOD39531.1 hypothetical protein SAMN06273570_3981 [Pantoea floridensis]
MEFHHKSWEEKAFDLANQGISLESDDQNIAATFSWAASAELAKTHLRDKEIYYWILSGYGSSLVKCQRYQEAIEAANEALEWEATKGQVLARMTLARALYGMGAIDGAIAYFQQIYAMKGEAVFDAFPEFDKKMLADLMGL